VALAELLVSTARDLGREAVAVVSDMSQPPGEWAGHACEVREVVECLRTGHGEARLLEVTCALAAEVARLAGDDLDAATALAKLRSGEAWARFVDWAAAQGAERAWLDQPTFAIAPVELVAEARTAGTLARVATRELGMLLLEAGGGRKTAGARIDPSISLRYRARLGERVEAGQELARLYVQPGGDALRPAFERCFEVEPTGQAPPTIHRVIRSKH
jgi:thymidine phosphorylase